MAEVEEILADPIIRSECGSDAHYLRNVLGWALKLAEAAHHGITTDGSGWVTVPGQHDNLPTDDGDH